MPRSWNAKEMRKETKHHQPNNEALGEPPRRLCIEKGRSVERKNATVACRSEEWQQLRRRRRRRADTKLRSNVVRYRTQRTELFKMRLLWMTILREERQSGREASR